MKNKINKNIGLKLTFIAALVICIVAAIYLGWNIYIRYAEQNEYKDLQDKVTIEDVENSDFTGERDGDAAEVPDVYTDGESNPINFETLQSYNEELIAWVKVPGTVINYPIARHEAADQTYYLNYNMYNKPAFCGCIYMENTNAADFTDYNTVIYGHNMRNGSMFNSLHKFADEDFFEENRYIYVYTPTHVFTYEIIAAYLTDDTKLTLAYDFSNEASFEKYINYLSNNRSMSANYADDRTLTKDDKMITLSTCVTNQREKRYVVQGVLVNDVKAQQ